jgi:hypothetical protein
MGRAPLARSVEYERHRRCRPSAKQIGSSKCGSPRNAKVAEICDEETGRYDRQMGLFEHFVLGSARRWALAQARGKVGEIGVGTGRNLPLYPARRSRTSAISSSQMPSADTVVNFGIIHYRLATRGGGDRARAAARRAAAVRRGGPLQRPLLCHRADMLDTGAIERHRGSVFVEAAPETGSDRSSNPGPADGALWNREQS